MNRNIILLSMCFTLLISCQAQENKQNDKDATNITALKENQYVLHKADTRGETKEDWLLSRHTFSFNNYYNKNRVGFGALLVLNDDWVKAGSGFGMHHHEEMEIISIPLIGAIAHKDSKGSSGITTFNKEKGVYTVQQMTAGSGISHSEYNASKIDSVRFLQIWVAPNKQKLTPAYNQKQFSIANQHNKWQTLVSPDDPGAIFVNQQAVFSTTNLDAGKTLDYIMKYGGGVYAFVLEGKASVNGIELGRRDGIGIVDISQLSIIAKEDLQILLMEVPVNQIL
jgi:redox-sensitive bicupin YhaK (pirin superfamily)